MKPWLLEVNGNPSLNIYFSPDELQQKKREDNLISPIDLYVKSQVLGDIVMMVKKNKIRTIREDLPEFKSYEKIFDQSIENSDFGNCSEYDSLLDMFVWLCGYKFFASLTMLKFSKVAPWLRGVGDRQVCKIDVDVAWKKIQGIGGCMTFDGFVWSLLELVRKCFSSDDPGDEEIQAGLVAVIGSYEIEKEGK
jgi:hypothetical protein